MAIHVKVLEGGNFFRDPDNTLREIKAGQVYPKTFESEDDIPRLLGPYEKISEAEAKKLEEERKAGVAKERKESADTALNAKRAEKVANGTVAKEAEVVKPEPKPEPVKDEPKAAKGKKDVE